MMSQGFPEVPEWALKIKHRGVQGVVLNLWSPWAPDMDRLERFQNTWKSLWIKNEWSEEGGGAGVWISYYDRAGERVLKSLEWNEGCIEEQAHLFRSPVSKSDGENGKEVTVPTWLVDTAEVKDTPCESVPKKKVVNPVNKSLA